MKKTGGSWNPSDRNKYFIASDINNLSVIDTGDNGLLFKNILVAVNELNSRSDQFINRALSLGTNLFIDSGIFNLTNIHARNHNVSMDTALNLAPDQIDGFQKLFDKYVSLIQHYGDKVWGYVELDQGGIENKIKTRTLLESMGINPIPVYHPFNDGWDYFDYLAANYDRICFGNVVQADGPTRKRLVATAWERKRKYPELWIHLLGYTPNQTLNAYPIDSADSSAWLSAVRWSGYIPRASLKGFGNLPKNFQYQLGKPKDHYKAVAMAAYGYNLDMQAWPALANRWQDYGFEIYPAEKENNVSNQK